MPLLFAAVAVADVESEISEGRSAATLLLEEIGFGVVGGIVGGLAVAAVLIHAGRRGLIDAAWRQVIPAAGAALAYGTAIELHGSGFIAAFVAGMTFRLAIRRDPGEVNALSEEVGNVLNGVTFVLFGAILLGPALGELSWDLALYAVLSLTVVRMLPVAIAMLGSRAQPPTVGFLAWFGPRGLASIVFAVIVIEESNLPQRAPARARDLPHRRALRLRPRAHRRAARRPLRALVRAPPAPRGPAARERRRRGAPRVQTLRLIGEVATQAAVKRKTRQPSVSIATRRRGAVSFVLMPPKNSADANSTTAST